MVIITYDNLLDILRLPRIVAAERKVRENSHETRPLEDEVARLTTEEWDVPIRLHQPGSVLFQSQPREYNLPARSIQKIIGSEYYAGTKSGNTYQRVGRLGTTLFYVAFLAACGSPTSPTPTTTPTPIPTPTPTPPGNGVTVKDYKVKTDPEGGIVNGTVTLQRDGKNVADIDMENSTINITPDKQISPGIYSATIKPKQLGTFYERTTPVSIDNNKLVVPLDGDLNNLTRTNDLEVRLNTYDLRTFQIGTQMTEFGGGSRRWDVTDQGTCPSQDIYTTLYNTNTDNFVKADPKDFTPEQWAKFMQRISYVTQAAVLAVNGMNTGPDGKQYSGKEMTSGGACKPKIRVEDSKTSLQQPGERFGNRLVVLPVTKTVGGGIMNPAAYATSGNTGQIYHAIIIYNINEEWEKSEINNIAGTFRIEMGFNDGIHVQKQGLGSGMILIDGLGNYLPETLTVSKALNKRWYGHISDSPRPDFNNMQK